jgi:predicted protein tyrosine phosphatase
VPRIHVCPLHRIGEVVTETGASHLVSFLNAEMPVERPAAIARERHLRIGISDIVTPLEGHVLPARDHVESLVGFARAWDRHAPLLIHCFAGVSRSTAGAFITLCALMPERREDELAQALRSASPTATPNSRLVALGDEVLGRAGRMIEAAARIGRGADCFEGEPFALELL